MQFDYIIDILVFGISILVIIFFSLIFLTANVDDNITSDVTDNRATMLEENFGRAVLETGIDVNGDGIKNSTFLLLANYYSMDNNQKFLYKRDKYRDNIVKVLEQSSGKRRVWQQRFELFKVPKFPDQGWGPNDIPPRTVYSIPTSGATGSLVKTVKIKYE